MVSPLPDNNDYVNRPALFFSRSRSSRYWFLKGTDFAVNSATFLGGGFFRKHPFSGVGKFKSFAGKRNK